MRHVHGIERLGERADLVQFDENAVGGVLLDASGQALRIGHEDVVADEVDLAAQPFSLYPPALPIVLGHAVLDGEDGIARDQIGIEIDHLAGLKALALALELILAIVEELGRSRIERNRHILARPIARLLDGAHNEGQRLIGRFEVRREAALVADIGAVAALFQQLLQRVEDSEPQRTASASVGAPSGEIMNS